MKKSVPHASFAALLAILSLVPLLSSAYGDGIAVGDPFLSVRLPESPSADERPSAGKFLVATRRITDPRFMEAVILLISHDRNGTMGLIINRPTEVKLSALLPDIKELQKSAETAFIGGPVGMGQLFMLIRSAAPPEDSLRIFRDVYVSTSKSVLQRAAGGGKGLEKFRLYAGYSGWGAGQLEQELLRGDWRILQADPETVFDKNPEKIWQDLIRRSSAILVEHEDHSAGLLAAKAR